MTSLPNLTVTLQGGLAELRLEFTRGNAIGPGLAAELGRALDALARDARVGALLLGAAPGPFCVGLDLVELAALDRAALAEFMDRFGDVLLAVFAFPRPSVAVLEGHAIGGGGILALAADQRVMVADTAARIGINAAELDIFYPVPALEVARYALPPACWPEAFLEGRRYTGDQALAAGVVQELASPARVWEAARARAERLSRGGSAGLARIKADLKAPALERIAARRQAGREAWLDAWFAPEAARRRAALLERLQTATRVDSAGGPG